MNSNHYSSQIKNLSHLLSKVHRSLLEFQKRIHEDLDQRRLTPHETLLLAINHPDFEWLRKISEVIAQMDEVAADKKTPATEESVKLFTQLLREIFIDDSQHTNLKKRLEIALEKDPTLCLEIAELRSALKK